MPLPTTFSPWEHLQSVLMQVQNRRVRADFNDVGGDDWDEDITTSRASLRVACTLRDDDSILQTLIRLWLFDIILKGASNLHPAIYGIPTTVYQEMVRFMPQVKLRFYQDLSSLPDGETPLEAEITFRVQGETSASMTPAKALVLANKIKAEFTVSGGYRWRKGRVEVSYSDLEKGYSLMIYAYSEAEGKEVISKILSLQGDAPDWKKQKKHELGEEPPLNPGNQFIYGKSRKAPRRYPVGYVRFRYATLSLHGMPNDVVLVDTTGLLNQPLLTA